MGNLARPLQFLRSDPGLDAVRAEGLQEQLPRGQYYCHRHTVPSAIQPQLGCTQPSLQGLCPPHLPVLGQGPNHEGPFMPATQCKRCISAPCRLRTDRGTCFHPGAMENAPGRRLRLGPPTPCPGAMAAPRLLPSVSSISPRIKLEMTVGSSRQMGGRDKGHWKGLSAGCRHGQHQALFPSHGRRRLAMSCRWDCSVLLDASGASGLSPRGPPGP